MNLFIFIPLAALLVALPFMFSLLREYREEKRVKQMENALPAVLTKISLLPPTVSFNELLLLFSKSYDPLSIEFRFALQRINKGMPPEKSIQEMNLGSSIILSQAKRMLVKVYNNGFPSNSALRELAEEICAVQEVSRESDASASLQKYSLLLSCAFLVPLIFALLFSISTKASSMLSFISTGGAEVQGAVFLSVNLYIVIFSLLVSIFTARQAGKAKSFIIYFLSTAPLALLVFNFTTLLL